MAGHTAVCPYKDAIGLLNTILHERGSNAHGRGPFFCHRQCFLDGDACIVEDDFSAHPSADAKEPADVLTEKEVRWVHNRVR
jgi:hypothetical protein